MKHVLITGATGGIGKATAMSLAEMGYKVTIHGRDVEKLKATKKEIVLQTKNSQVQTLLFDMSSLESIESAIGMFIKENPILDVLINNAGVSPYNKIRTKNDFEMNFGVNNLATTLITRLFIPALKRSMEGRIVIVASIAYAMGTFKKDDLELSKRSYSMMNVYGTSKLYDIYIAQQFSEMLKDEKITVNALHPGIVKSALFRDSKGVMKWINAISAKIFYVTPQEGAKTSVYLASSPEVKGVTGKFFSKSKEKKLQAIVYNEEYSDLIWKRVNTLLDTTGVKNA